MHLCKRRHYYKKTYNLRSYHDGTETRPHHLFHDTEASYHPEKCSKLYSDIAKVVYFIKSILLFFLH